MPDERLVEVLTDAIRLGVVGISDPQSAITRSRLFHRSMRPASTVVDLGAGGGLPGLILAWDLPETAWWFIDARQQRCDLLSRAVSRLGLSDRVTVVCGRAERVVDSRHLRGVLDTVVARSFGPPAVVAEIAAPMLRVGGQLLVAEPSEVDPSRWPSDQLERLGLDADVTEPDESMPSGPLASFTLVKPCPSGYPRSSIRRPLW